MRFFIKSLSLYFIVCSLIYVLLVCLWGEFIPGAFRKNLAVEDTGNNTYLRLQDVENYADIDILFLGSSRAYSSFDTRIYERLGYSAFNLGTSAQTPIQTQVLLEQYLNVLNPETIIYEVSPSMFSSDGVESATDIVANGTCDLNAIRMGIKSKHIKVLNTMIFKLYLQYIKGDRNTETSKPNNQERYIHGGYVEAAQMEFKPLKLASVPVVEQINPEQIAAFKSILEMIHSKHIQLILLQIPYTPEKYETFHTINQVFDTEMHRYGTYYNLNESMNLTDTLDFRDELHLNLNGVKLLNKKVIDMLHL